MSGDPRQLVADINFIPSAVVKRVDVLTGGASSVYGADAVAGVVNFIMDTNFRGLRIDVQASTFMHDNNTNAVDPECAMRPRLPPPHGKSINGGAQDIAVAFGAGFDDNRGSIMAYATYRKQDAGASGDPRLFVLRAGGRATTAHEIRRPPPRDFNCGGSATSAPGTFFTNVGNVPRRPGNQFVPAQVPFNFAPVQLLPASGRALHVRRVRRI